jgi:hypothetical protein
VSEKYAIFIRLRRIEFAQRHSGLSRQSLGEDGSPAGRRRIVFEFFILVIRICPSTLLGMVSLSNHLGYRV